MAQQTQTHGYACFDPVAFEILVDILISLGDVQLNNHKDKKKILQQCLNPKHPYNAQIMTRAQQILEMGARAYLITIENTVSGLQSGVLNSKRFTPSTNTLNTLMRYLLALPSLLEVDKFDPNSIASIKACDDFNATCDDVRIIYDAQAYRNNLISVWNQFQISSGSCVWIPISSDLQTTLCRISNGDLLFNREWRSGVGFPMVLPHVTQLIVMMASEYVDNKAHPYLPRSPLDLSIIMSGYFNS